VVNTLMAITGISSFRRLSSRRTDCLRSGPGSWYTWNPGIGGHQRKYAGLDAYVNPYGVVRQAPTFGQQFQKGTLDGDGIDGGQPICMKYHSGFDGDVHAFPHGCGSGAVSCHPNPGRLPWIVMPFLPLVNNVFVSFGFGRGHVCGGKNRCHAAPLPLGLCV